MKRVLLLAVLTLGLASLAWAIDPSSELRDDPPAGASYLDDDCGDCSIDYFGLRYSGTGGEGGRGNTFWIGGGFSSNYGQMCFHSTCEDFSDPLYAWCVDLYHSVQTHDYGVNIVPQVITADQCRELQLTAMGYLGAWSYPTTTLLDDAFQLAIWKLSDVRNGGPNHGVPHFCVDAGRGYPNIGDTPAYPYVNTVYNDNPWRNDWANSHVLDALGKNVYLPGDFLLCTWDDPAIIGNTSTLTIKWCLERGAYAQSVNNLGVAGVKIEGTYQVAGQDPVTATWYTDANGCFSVDITQPLDDPQPVTFTVCTNSSWPIGLEACDQSNWNKQRLIVAEEPTRHCETCYIPGEPWFNAELSSFDAVTSADGVELTWSTASETNTEGWLIERRAAEGGNFAMLAELPARNLPTGADYRYTDRYGVVGRTYEYRLTDVDMDGVRTAHGTRTAVFGSNSGAVLEFALNDAYPNPFNPTTTISFTLPEAGFATLRIFDVAGREIAELVNGTVNAGETSVVWNAQGIASGTYFYTLEAASFSVTKKLTLLK